MLLGGVLSPVYWLLAYRQRVPGLEFRRQIALLALHLLCRQKKRIPLKLIYRMLLWPMDSVRYFEFGFAWETLSDLPIQSYLDVSSPRLFPIVLASKKPEVRGELVNPDLADLTSTIDLAKAVGLDRRCGFHTCLIGDAPFHRASFDVITSISVVEHIPDDTRAIRKIWGFLKPGGRLLLTVPCAAEALDEYIDRNEYGLLEPTEGDFYFFQRYYDEKALAERIFSVTGIPSRYAVYGEKLPGIYRNSERAKRSNPCYPIWREPYVMGQNYRHFESVRDLPGVGVIAMEFFKA